MNRSSLFSKNGLVHRIVQRHLEHTTSYAHGILLDVGCGGRPYSLLYDAGITRYIGLEYPGPYSKDIRFDIGGDALHLPCKNESIDTVLSNQVIEHVREPWTMLAEIERVLKPGGTLILTAPHIWGLHNEPDDYYRFTKYGLRYLLDKAGLQVIYIHAMAGYWVTAGARFCYYVARIIRPRFLLPPVYAVVQVIAKTLDRLHHVESDTWNYIAVATKTSGTSP